MASTEQTAEDFLTFAHKFKLGCLLTEQQNPKTVGMAELAQNNLQQAIQMIKGLDVDTINILASKLPELHSLYQHVNDTLQTGGRIFICGCGATGRLAIVLQTLWRQECRQIYKDWNERVIAFMAGGDAALIKSVEDFEDHPEFAHQHLVQLGFKENDMLIGSTEGGQTSWVIGAVWKSTQLTKRKPFILYGNTDQILVANVQRSKEFIESDKILKINCNVGNMALAGSTRMQSTTILMYAIGLTLLGCDRFRNIKYPGTNWKDYANKNVTTFQQYLHETDFTIIDKLIEYEANLYAKGQLLTYQTDSYYAVSILTDTTQRSPTFSLTPFHNKFQPQQKPSWCNLKILSNESDEGLTWQQLAERDWKQMLGGRQIRGLNSGYWQKYKEKVANKIILGFGMHTVRQNKITVSHPFHIKVTKGEEQIMSVKFPQYPLDCRLSHHSLVKVILNNLSTLIMGRMRRYTSNIMTYVKPSNYKLIDRAARYVLILRPQTKYEQAVHAIYAIRYKIAYDEPIVLKVIEYLDQLKGQAKE